MTACSIAHLTDRALIRVGGPDAHDFLQNLVSADIATVDSTGAGSAALLTPQGKIQFDFLIFRTRDSYLLDTPVTAAPDLLKRLTFYRLRSKVELELLDGQTGVFAVWDGSCEPAAAEICQPDPRLGDLGWRLIGSIEDITKEVARELADPREYDAHRIAQGVPEGLKDYDYSDIFPHDADLDQLGGVSFTKGCFVGQEVVARMQHRSTARKRFVRIESPSVLPEKGTDIMVSGKSVGVIGSSARQGDRSIGLALLRLDKAAIAEENGDPLTCADAVVRPDIPRWAEFSWPEPSGAA